MADPERKSWSTTARITALIASFHSSLPKRTAKMGLEMSQSREDSVRIQEQIILPVVLVKLPADEYLIYSRSFGGAEIFLQGS